MVIRFVLENRDSGSPSSSGPTGLRIDNFSGTVDVIVPDNVSHLTDYAAIYVEGNPVAIVDSDIQISDQDGDMIAGATITLTNAQIGDLFITDGLPSGITATISASGSIVTLSGTATAATYEQAIQLIKFSNSSDTPNNSVDRIISIAVTDGANNSNAASSTIRVVTADDAPVVDPDANHSYGNKFVTSYTENGAGIAIVDVDVKILDVDSTTLHSATIQITNIHTGDRLSVSGLPAGLSVSEYDPINGVLIISGTASLSVYEDALKSLKFLSTSENPAEIQRDITISVNDGHSSSVLSHSYVNVVAVNDVPTNSATISASTVEDAPAITLNLLANSSDVDGDSLSVSSVTYTVDGVATANNGTSLPTGVTLSGSSLTIDTTNPVFDSLAKGETPQTIVANYTVSDGKGGSVTQSATTTIAGVNDAPVLDVSKVNITLNSTLTSLYTWSGGSSGWTKTSGNDAIYFDASVDSPLSSGNFIGTDSSGGMQQISDFSGKGTANVVQTSTDTVSLVAGSSYNFVYDAKATNFQNSQAASFKWVIVDSQGNVVQDLTDWYATSAGGSVTSATVLPSGNTWANYNFAFTAVVTGSYKLALEWSTPGVQGQGQDVNFDRIQIQNVNYQNSLSNIFASAVTDVDNSSSVKGYAITQAAADASGHHWQYSSDSGVTWINMDNATTSAALFLKPSDLIRWTGGEVKTQLTVVAVDNTSTAAFDTTATGHLDVTVRGGTTPYSNEYHSSAISVTANATGTIFANSWETSANSNSSSDDNTGVTSFEGWTLVTSVQARSGGTNGFEVWSSGDDQDNANNNTNKIVASAGNGTDFLELNDSGVNDNGTNMLQTIGISRLVPTQAGMVYELSLDIAGRPGFTSDYTRLGIYLDGVLLTQASPTSPSDYIDWKNMKVYFTGDGSTHTLMIRTDATTTNSNGRGVFIDDIVLTEVQGVVARNATTYTDVALSNYIHSTITDTSETVSLTLSGLPTGASIVVGTTTYAQTAGSITILGSDLANAHLHLNSSTTGHLSLGVTATASEAGYVTAKNSTTLELNVVSHDAVISDLGGDGLKNIIGTTGDDPLATSGNNVNTSSYLVGGEGNDHLTSGRGTDYLDGGLGNDILVAGGGNDHLYGGAGNDTMTGGTDTDTFIWNYSDRGIAGSPDVDHITDFDKSTDVIDIRELLDTKGESATDLLKHLSVADTTTGITISIHNGTVNTVSTDVTNQIVLDGVHSTSGVSASDLLTTLINSQHLLIDKT